MAATQRPAPRPTGMLSAIRNAAAILKDKKAEATTVRELRAWIEREIHLDLTNARLTRGRNASAKGGSVRSLSETNGQQPASLSRSPAKINLLVKWNSLWQENSPRMIARFAEAGLYASLASPGTKACDAVGGALGRSGGSGQQGRF
jgi:hypothetical protein